MWGMCSSFSHLLGLKAKVAIVVRIRQLNSCYILRGQWFQLIAEKSYIRSNEKYHLSTHFRWISLLLWLVGFTLFSGLYVITHRYKILSREFNIISTSAYTEVL